MAEKDSKEEDKKSEPIIIKRINKGGGHHGGAWKVAYADFVTAMMAFFLLLWLLNVTTQEELNAISNYFDPTDPKIARPESGAGGILGGLSVAAQGAMATVQQPVVSQRPTPDLTRPQPKTPEQKKSENLEKAKEKLRKEEEKKFDDTKKKIEKAIKEDAELKELAKNLIVDITPEGLRIQIVDQDGEPMFASGSAQMFDKTRKLITKVAQVIQTLPNQLSVRGHTDSTPYAQGATYTNWELSADRANASRRVLLESGTPVKRLNNVVGKADTEHLFPANASDPRNRRISIILLKEELTNPDFAKKAETLAKEKETEAAIEEQMDQEETDQGQPIGTFQKTPGAVEFP
ncbi:MAG: flagellar motor protein MotB [Alphaproteobacteria bacterium]|nr:flagellar motor protein MotB [Alphaproteobacteria bacterium]